MKMKKTALATLVGAALLGGGVAQASVSADKAAALGKSLTPMGSEKAGNAAGTIPEWTGGITRAPAGYKAGGNHIDPFAGDKVLFQITPANYKQYSENLGAGQEAMFAKYKDYRMDVYPVVLVLREHRFLAGAEVFRILLVVGRGDLEQHLVARERVDVVAAGLVAGRRAGDAAGPLRNRAGGVAGLLRAHRRQALAELRC